MCAQDGQQFPNRCMLQVDGTPGKVDSLKKVKFFTRKIPKILF